MMRRLTSLALSAVLIGACASAQAAAPTDFCLKRPTHPKCVIQSPKPSPTPTPSVAPSPSPQPSPSPSPAPSVAPSPSPSPSATPAPSPSPSTVIKSVRVTSVEGILSTLLDNTVDEIVVANGTYRISGANYQYSNSLFIGSKFASRTRAVTVRAETKGGVTFDGGGVRYFGGITFDQGSHHQTWDGFNFANGEATETGVIVIGSANVESLAVGSHHITLRNITLTNIHGYAYDPSRSNVNDHGVYFSDNLGGAHDILIENLTVVAPAVNPVHTALHFYTHGYSVPGVKGAYNVVVRNLNATGMRVGVILWDRLGDSVVIEDSTIVDSKDFGVRYEYGTNVTLRRVTTINSGYAGFYSSIGSTPPGVTFIECHLD